MAAQVAVPMQSSPGPVQAPSPTGSTSSAASSSGPSSSAVEGHSLSRPTSNTEGPAAKNAAANFPTKTDKPRPHVCTTCSRSFARLEHLKRHERSHTKEKPFECPECTRCFARRDLLLRHQQKLHMTTTPASRQRGRRESTTSMAGNPSKVRKNSMNTHATSGSAGLPSVRPRANTISHVDAGQLGMLAAANRSAQNNASSQNLTSPPQQQNGFEQPRGMSASQGHRNMPPQLPRLATTGHSMEMGGGLRTAPPAQNMQMNFEGFNFGSTINPAQLHMGSAGVCPPSPFNGQNSPFTPQPAIMEDDDAFDWVSGFNAHMSFQGNGAEGMPDMQHHQQPQQQPQPQHVNGMQFNQHMNMQTPNMMWHDNGMMQQPGDMNQMQMDVSQPGNFQHMEHLTQTVSPDSLHPVTGMPPDHMYSHPPSLSPNSIFSALPGQLNPHPALSNDGTSVSSVTGSVPQSSVTSASTDSISEATRTALLLSLSQPSVFGSGHRKFSQPNISSPLSPQATAPKATFQATLPSTYDLQRFVGAYIQYFHPHFPFLHVATLSFDTPHYTSNIRRATGTANGHAHGGIVGGGGCLILAMAAIGALYEFDRQSSRELFEAAKKMIQLYLEERRKADLATAANNTRGNGGDMAAQNTPLWLVQAMLLNVIYGHNCGDKMAGDIASTHCTALVSLARAAELTKGPGFGGDAMDVDAQDGWADGNFETDEHRRWRKWVGEEERKRTVFAIFHMSCLLVASYNHPPALMNSEIQLDLPCDEELWAAPDASVWIAKQASPNTNCEDPLSFSVALGELLSAGQRQQNGDEIHLSRPFGSGVPLEDVPKSDLRPSTFGCLVLIDALHNYIWETRQRHSGRKWTTQETESMHAHIEPALRAWQSAWASHPGHSLERPNPKGHGPLSADSIPLLDLAYVRLFVNLGTSKEALWQRDFERMTEEFARGQEIVQHAEHTDALNGALSIETMQGSPEPVHGQDFRMSHSPDGSSMSSSQGRNEQCSKRERLLRKAAFYAADSLSMSDKLGVTFAEFTSRELPVQSVLCTFDCAQILAEWVATIQERVGHFIGMLGRDNIDFTQVPAIMLLGDEDCKLLGKIAEILQKAEQKMTLDMQTMNPASQNAMNMMKALPSSSDGGYGGKILRIAAWHLQRAAVWPITGVMADGLLVQAAHIQKRAEMSLSQS